MEVEHFIHRHPLIFREEAQEGLDCKGCLLPISGQAYTCKDCDFTLHKSCSDLPFEISLRFHDDHPLFLRILNGQSDCAKCYDKCIGITYHCAMCCFTLDYKCAFLPDSVLPKQEPVQASINHFLHNHPLVLDNSWENSKFLCFVCQSPLSPPLGSSAVYSCIQCVFFIHKTCIGKVQKEIQHHPYHLKHSFLTARATDRATGVRVQCGACKVRFRGISYSCYTCRFYLHVDCANSEKLIPTLKHNCHEQHNLYYFMSDNDDLFTCHVCDNSCVGSFYRCVECDRNYHFECLPLPESILKCHFHKHKPLVFKDVYAEEEYIEGHYCDACEDLRNPIYSVYFCDECRFAVDIACMLSEKDSKMEVLEYMAPRPRIKLEHFIHKHPICKEQAEGDVRCNGCSAMISGLGYGCQDCNFHLHESCLELPFEIRHPAHKKHPLFLRILNGQSNCSKCNEKCVGFTYHCGMCCFTIDYKCIQSTKQEEEKEEEEEEEEETEAQGSDTGHEEIGAKEPTIAQLTETNLVLRTEVEKLRKKVDMLTTEMEAIKQRLPNTSTQS